MLEGLQLFDDREERSAALNMAVDEALLADCVAPVLRFYRWQRPSLSFGYFGRYAEVATESDGRDLVRRWTGGGIVPHGADVTYSLIVPRGHSFFERSSVEIYAAVHDAIRRAFKVNGIDAVLANGAAPKVSEVCFANAVRADVISGGEKIAGAAHRRTRSGLLHQGSIQRKDLPERFREDFASILDHEFEGMAPTSELNERAAEIAENKYATNEWLTRW